MFRPTPFALCIALVVASVTQGPAANAHPRVRVGIGFSAGTVVEPLTYAPAYYAPYYLTQARYWRNGHDRYRHFPYEHWRRC